MSTKGIRPRSTITGISCCHCSRDRSTPVGLWQLACSSTTLPEGRPRDRKSTRLNSSHLVISYAVFCLKKKKLTKNQAVATSQEAVQNQNEPQLRDENAHNDKSVHGVLSPTYQAGLRRDAVQPDIEAERKKRDEIEAGIFFLSRRFPRESSLFPSAPIYG